jgi:hypothetical protein
MYVAYGQYSEIVIVRYMDYSIINVAAVNAFDFCIGSDVEEKYAMDSFTVNLIKTEILSLQPCTDTLLCKYFPNVRRQLILYHMRRGNYKIVSYDTVCMEMNGELVVYNQRLADLIEELLDNHESSAK